MATRGSFKGPGVARGLAIVGIQRKRSQAIRTITFLATVGRAGVGRLRDRVDGRGPLFRPRSGALQERPMVSGYNHRLPDSTIGDMAANLRYPIDGYHLGLRRANGRIA